MKIEKNKMKLYLDRIGTTGIFLTALATPCCFPLLGFILPAVGLGSAALFGDMTEYIFQGLVLFSITGTLISYHQLKNISPLVIGLISGGFIIYAYNFNFDERLIYAGMLGLLASAGINYYLNRKHKIACVTCAIIDGLSAEAAAQAGKTVELESIITCPYCGHKKKEIMPTDSCQFFYDCESCKQVIKPKPGDCCVYCSYGTVKCPSKQSPLLDFNGWLLNH